MGQSYWTVLRSVLEREGHRFPPDDPERVRYRHEVDGSVVITATHSAWAAPVVVKVDGAAYQRAWQAAANHRKD